MPLSTYAGRGTGLGLFSTGAKINEENGRDPEAINRLAGLEYTINEEPLYYAREEFHPLEGYKRIYRKDTDKTFYIGSDGFEIGIQPNQIAGFFTEWLGADGEGYNIQCAGTLHQGAAAFMLIQLRELYKVAGVDAYKLYCMLSVGWDGKTTLQGNDTQIRVVCENTYRMARAEKGGQIHFKMKHTTNMMDKALNAAKALQVQTQAQWEAMQRLEILAQATATQGQVEQLFDIAAPLASDGASDRRAREAQEKRYLLWKVYNTSPTVDKGMLYGAVNAVTEFIDWVEPRKGQNSDSKNADHQERRLLYSIEGDGANRRDLVINTAIKMATFA